MVFDRSLFPCQDDRSGVPLMTPERFAFRTRRSQERTVEQLDRDLDRYARELGAELYGVASAADSAAEFPDKSQLTTCRPCTWLVWARWV